MPPSIRRRDALIEKIFFTIGLILTIILIVGSAIAAKAQEFLLSEHGVWAVYYVPYERGEGGYCTARTVNAVGEMFSIGVNENVEATVFYSVHVDHTWSGGARRLEEASRTQSFTDTFTIDGERWRGEIESYHDLGNGMVMGITPQIYPEFVRALRAGTWIRNDWNTGWSLSGSNAAMHALGTCVERLR